MLEIVQQYFHSITQTVDSVWKEQARRQLQSKQTAQLHAAESQVTKLQAQQARLRQEVMKSLMDDSMFDTELLKSMLDDNKAALAEAEKHLEICREEKASEKTALQRLSEQYRHISDWAEEFAAANADSRKMILARIIEKITVDREYHINITFFVTEASFCQQISQADRNVKILEAGQERGFAVNH